MKVEEFQKAFPDVDISTFSHKKPEANPSSVTSVSMGTNYSKDGGMEIS